LFCNCDEEQIIVGNEDLDGLCAYRAEHPYRWVWSARNFAEIECPGLAWVIYLCWNMHARYRYHVLCVESCDRIQTIQQGG
jgi:hypothetical protein